MWNFEFCDIIKERVKVLIPIKSSLIFYFNNIRKKEVKINLLASHSNIRNTQKINTTDSFLLFIEKCKFLVCWFFGGNLKIFTLELE